MNVYTQESRELGPNLKIHKKIAEYFCNERVVSTEVSIKKDLNHDRYITFISLCIEQIGHTKNKLKPYLLFDININDSLEIIVYEVENLNNINRSNAVEIAELKNVIPKLPLDGTIKNFMKKFKYNKDGYNIGRINSIITPYSVALLNIFNCVKNLKDKYTKITFKVDLNIIEVFKGSELVLKGELHDLAIWLPELEKSTDIINLSSEIIDKI